jgi:hypothetical protein
MLSLVYDSFFSLKKLFVVIGIKAEILGECFAEDVGATRETHCNVMLKAVLTDKVQQPLQSLLPLHIRQTSRADRL